MAGLVRQESDEGSTEPRLRTLLEQPHRQIGLLVPTRGQGHPMVGLDILRGIGLMLKASTVPVNE